MVGSDAGLICLALVARFHDTPAEPDQLRHQLGLAGPCSTADLLRAARIYALQSG